jgi:4-carboxymuconolactone decarboxylase
MPRIPLIARVDEIPLAHRDVWMRIAKSRGSVVGPFAALLHSPVLADRTSELGAYIRFDSGLSATDRELVILSVARVFDCHFEWAYHVREARKAGLSAEAIAAIRERRARAGLTDDEADIVRYVSQLLVTHRTDDGVPARAARRAGRGRADGDDRLLCDAGLHAERLRGAARGRRGGARCSVTS